MIINYSNHRVFSPNSLFSELLLAAYEWQSSKGVSNCMRIDIFNFIQKTYYTCVHECRALKSSVSTESYIIPWWWWLVAFLRCKRLFHSDTCLIRLSTDSLLPCCLHSWMLYSCFLSTQSLTNAAQNNLKSSALSFSVCI